MQSPNIPFAAIFGNWLVGIFGSAAAYTATLFSDIEAVVRLMTAIGGLGLTVISILVGLKQLRKK